MDELRARFAALVQQHGTRSFRVTFSAGVACSELHPQMEGLINAADRALYRAKDAGRNRVCMDLPAPSRKSGSPEDTDADGAAG
jgi:diguanylate cyclase (GGDEF)-like protein